MARRHLAPQPPIGVLGPRVAGEIERQELGPRDQAGRKREDPVGAAELGEGKAIERAAAAGANAPRVGQFHFRAAPGVAENLHVVGDPGRGPIGLDRADDFFEMVGHPQVVRFAKGDVGAGRFFRAEAEGGGEAEIGVAGVTVQANEIGAAPDVFADDLDRAIGGTVVHHDDFEVLVGLGQQRIEGLANQILIVVAGNHHADFRRRRGIRVCALNGRVCAKWAEKGQDRARNPRQSDEEGGAEAQGI